MTKMHATTQLVLSFSSTEIHWRERWFRIDPFLEMLNPSRLLEWQKQNCMAQSVDDYIYNYVKLTSSAVFFYFRGVLPRPLTRSSTLAPRELPSLNSLFCSSQFVHWSLTIPDKDHSKIHLYTTYIKTKSPRWHHKRQNITTIDYNFIWIIQNDL